MTMSAPDLGGSGNGLGLPIANPLYGPGNAAVLANLAQSQNMAQAQATTAETQARTNRDIQTLQPDIDYKNAQTGLTTQQAAAAKIENDAKNVLGPDRIAAGMNADILSKTTEAAQKSHDYVQNQVMKNADILDGNVAQGRSDLNQQMLEQWGKDAGLKPGEASTLYSGVARINAPQAPNAGPGTAGQANQPPQPGGYANFRKLLMLANPDIMKESMSQEGATARTAMTNATEKEIATQKIAAEKEIENIRGLQDPEKAASILTQRYYDLKDTNPEAATQYAKEAMDLANQKGFYAQSAGYSRQAYNPLTPLLSQIATKATGKPAVSAPQPSVGNLITSASDVNAPPVVPSVGNVPPPAAAPAPAAAAKTAPPVINEIRNGWQFKGGDPANKNNWVKVQ